MVELDAYLSGESVVSTGCPGSKSVRWREYQKVFGDLFLLGVTLLSLAGWNQVSKMI
jgi:hypothetical protein